MEEKSVEEYVNSVIGLEFYDGGLPKKFSHLVKMFA